MVHKNYTIPSRRSAPSAEQNRNKKIQAVGLEPTPSLGRKAFEAFASTIPPCLHVRDSLPLLRFFCAMQAMPEEEARLFCLFLSTKGHAHKHTTKSKRIRTVTIRFLPLRSKAAQVRRIAKPRRAPCSRRSALRAILALPKKKRSEEQIFFFTTDCIKIEASWKWAHTKRPFAPIRFFLPLRSKAKRFAPLLLGASCQHALGIEF